MSWKRVIGAMFLAPILFFPLFFPYRVSAAIIPVTTTNDEINDNNECSLREAIESANTDTAIDSCPAGSGVDTIILSAGIYSVNLPAPETEFDNSGGALTIKDSVTISGAGYLDTIIAAVTGLNDPVIHSGASTPINVQIIGVTLQGGERVASLWNAVNSHLTLRSSAVMSGTGNMAGGIHNQAHLSLVDSVVAGNSSVEGNGGINSYSPVTITRSLITDNTSQMGTGGIYSQGTIQMLSSTVSSNVGVSGGGITVFNGAPNLVANSVISANHAISRAGGIFIFGQLTISQTTVVSNSASLAGGIGNAGTAFVESSEILSNTADSGGGIGNAGMMKIQDSHIAHNTAAEIGGGIGNDGGTHYLSFLIGSLDITNSTIEDNQAARGGGIGQAGNFTMTATIVRDNEASERGGGISIGNGSTAILGSRIENNSAPFGGGLFVTNESQYGTITTTVDLSMTNLLSNDGGNCAVEGGTTTSQGNNQSSDGTCIAILNDDTDANEEGGSTMDTFIYLPKITP